MTPELARTMHGARKSYQCPCYVKEGQVFTKKACENEDAALLGFKDNLPVLAKTIQYPGKTPVQGKRVILKTDPSSGKKFIVLAGKVVEVKEVQKPKMNQQRTAFKAHIKSVSKPKPTPMKKPDKKMLLIEEIKKYSTIYPEESLQEQFLEYLRENERNPTNRNNCQQNSEILVNISIKRDGDSHKKPSKKQTCEKGTSTDDLPKALSPEPSEQASDMELSLQNLFEDILCNDVNMGSGPRFEFGNHTNTENMRVENVVQSYQCEVPQQVVESVVGGNEHQQQLVLQIFNDYNNCLSYDTSGNMPIHHAVMNSNVSLVERQCSLLRFRGETVNATSYSEYTPIQLAVLNNVDARIPQILLNPENQPDVTVIDKNGNNIVHMAVLNSNEQLLDLLLDALKSYEFELDSFNYDGLTPLMLCCLHSKLRHAGILLVQGVDPNVRDQKSGRTALFHAVEANNPALVRLLLQYKANPRIRNYIGTSPHDAMFELENVAKDITVLILGKQLPVDKKKRRRDARRGHQSPEKSDETAVVSSPVKVGAKVSEAKKFKFEMVKTLQKVDGIKM